MSYTRLNFFALCFNHLRPTFRIMEFSFLYRENLRQRTMAIFHDAEWISRCVKQDPVAVADRLPLLHTHRVDLVDEALDRPALHRHRDVALEVLAVRPGHDLLDAIEDLLELRGDAVDLPHDRHRLLATER